MFVSSNGCTMLESAGLCGVQEKQRAYKVEECKVVKSVGEAAGVECWGV